MNFRYREFFSQKFPAKYQVVSITETKSEKLQCISQDELPWYKKLQIILLLVSRFSIIIKWNTLNIFFFTFATMCDDVLVIRSRRINPFMTQFIYVKDVYCLSINTSETSQEPHAVTINQYMLVWYINHKGLNYINI